MKKERLLKLMLVLVIGTILFFTTPRTYVEAALSDDDSDLYFENITDTTTTPTPTPTIVATPTPTIVTPTPTPSTNYDTDLPKAGKAENTILGVSAVVLSGIAIFAYKKVKEYKNI